MSTLSVKVERIRAIQPHPNADRLELATVLGWQCVVQKGSFKEGDLCVYFPIDSILPQTVEGAIFGPDSKVKLHKQRIKTIKLRGAISQGLAVDPEILREWWGNERSFNCKAEGDDLTAKLGVTKYEPPPPRQSMRGQQVSWRKKNPHFLEYTDIENAKNYPDTLSPNEYVVITEKIHGSNFRAGWVPFQPDTLWKRILKWVRLAPSHEFVYGSRRVQLQDPTRLGGTGFYERSSNVEGGAPIGNIYQEIVEKYNLRKVIHPGLVLYGEVYGYGVQKDYHYDCGPDERKVVFFDVMRENSYLDQYESQMLLDAMKLPSVPILWEGPYSEDIAKRLSEGPSVLHPGQKVREGVVVKPLKERWDAKLGRVVLKFVNAEYLLGNQTEFH